MSAVTRKLIFFLIVGFAILLVALVTLLMPILYYRFGPPDLEATKAVVAIRATEVALTVTEAAVAATRAATEGPRQAGETAAGTDELTWNGLKLRVVAVNREAWLLIQAQNQNNEPPLSGRTMLMITVEVTNVAGSEEGPVSINSSDFKLIGEQRLLYTTYDEETRCGVIPDELDGVVAWHSYPMTGNICFQVPQDEGDFQLVYEQYVGDYPAIYIDLPEPEAGGKN
jgi:hypothetical protein